ncbi:MAG: FtsX-like permease family protein [Anaerolineaceae bacterium]|nr:FtsX-like permease family protein [Anaerolineaceae bacterium]
MSVLWYKAWFDLWHSRTRTLLAILSIAAGVFAIGAIFGMVDQLLSGMDAAHRAVTPSHLNIILRDLVDEATAEDLADLPGVVDVDPVNLITVRFKQGEDAPWQSGSLVMRPDYDNQTFDLMRLTSGAWPSDLEIGVERLTSQYFDANLGDEIIFELPNSDRAFTVNGTVRHPFVQPPPFGGQAYFFTDGDGLARFGIPEDRYNQLLVQVEPYSRDFAEEMAGEIRARLADQGYSVAVTIYQEPDEHWGRMFVEGVMLVLQLMAVVSLFLSVVLVTNTMTALITQQTDQIGVIKAIGGQSGTIVRLYLAEIGVYGLLALLISLPLGALTAFYSSRWFLNLFNIEYNNFRFSPQAVWWQVVAATAVPLLAALWPVLKGAAITVREAIASYGLGADFGNSKLDQFVEQTATRLLPSPYPLALGNMFRRKGRLLLTLLVLITAGVMFLVVMSLISSVNHTLDNDLARRGYDIRLGFGEVQRAEQVKTLAEELPGVAYAEAWYARNATILREGERLQDSAGLGAQLTGIPIETEMQQPLIVNGRWLQPGDERVLIISQETANENRIGVGDTIRLDLGNQGEAEWLVVGTYKVVYGGGFVTEALYAPLPAVMAAIGQIDRASLLYVQTESQDEAVVTAVSTNLQNMFEDRRMDIDLFTSATKAEERLDIENQFFPIVGMFISLASLVATVGGMGLMGSLGISVVERTREIGVMRAIGARSPTIISLFIMEGVLQGVLSWLVAVPLAFFISQPLARLLGQTMLEIDLDFAFNWTAVLIWLISIILISVLAAIWPARQATRISVRESLAYA